MVNKRGWIRIVEAMVAILLITGTILVLINKNNEDNPRLVENIYNFQISLVREIQLDESLRTNILLVDQDNLPLDWADFSNNGLSGLMSKINSRTPSYLECEAKICELDKICSLNKLLDKNIYSQSVAITATRDIYSPRQLKLFCWTKE